jgi:hypothetical protein
MNTTIHVDAETLAKICKELDRPTRHMPFETAADLGLRFAGGFDHAEVKARGWTLKLHDRGMNGHCNDFTFSVPTVARTSYRGPLA